MPFHASWVHGNAITVENAGSLNRVGHFGWGGDMAIKPGVKPTRAVPVARSSRQ